MQCSWKNPKSKIAETILRCATACTRRRGTEELLGFRELLNNVNNIIDHCLHSPARNRRTPWLQGTPQQRQQRQQHHRPWQVVGPGRSESRRLHCQLHWRRRKMPCIFGGWGGGGNEVGDGETKQGRQG
ncbi:hypothetical protein NE237_001500 [Protea cynaroides]|uniref:Uncharacterized protein n=1 Tax=Protea cynaroides TaxID=273540 RepID=A0A9Q0QYH8_9MAGN|nr:hypothetical protein NE237_001500 [Protea cynaroides]